MLEDVEHVVIGLQGMMESMSVAAKDMSGISSNIQNDIDHVASFSNAVIGTAEKLAVNRDSLENVVSNMQKMISKFKIN